MNKKHRFRKIRCNQNLYFAYIIVFAGCFMFFIYEPILMYSTNIDDFWFDLGIMLVPTMEIFSIFLCGGIVAVTVIYYINRLFSRRIIVYKIIILTGFLIFLAAYVQGNLLIKDLPSLDGSEIVWESYGQSESFILILLIIVFIVMTIKAIKKYRFNKLLKSAVAVSVILCVMLAVSLVYAVVQNSAWRKKENAVFSMDQFDTLSENKNFLIFLVDAVDAGEFSAVLDKNPEYCSIFDNFTYYEDTDSVYAFTTDAVPLILSGKMNKNEQDFWRYSSDAYNNSELFSALNNETTGGEYEINIYDPEIIWSGNREYNVCNVISDYDPHFGSDGTSVCHRGLGIMYIFRWGGNRKGTRHTCYNLLVVMILSGLWHGSTLNFLLWGTLHGVFSGMETFIRQKCKDIRYGRKRVYLKNILSRIFNFCIVIFLWIFFRVKNIQDVFMIFRKILCWEPGITYVYSYMLIFMGGLIVMEIIAAVRFNGDNPIVPLNLKRFRNKILFCIQVVSIVAFGYFGNTDFIYSGF